MTDLEFRSAEPGDWRLYREVRLRALRESPDAYSSTFARESQLPALAWRRRIGSAHTIIVLQHGEVVATATGIPNRGNSRRREVVAMWVSPDFRGARIATALLDRLADWAHLQGATELVLWVAEGNEAAVRAYSRAGFSPTGERASLRDEVGEELWVRGVSDP
ncbi:N-acetyltransferase family protein [Schumannella luteola]